MHMVLFLEASDSPVAAAGGRDSIGLSLGVLRDAAAASCTLTLSVWCRGSSSWLTALAHAWKPRWSLMPQAVSTPGES